MLKQIETVKLKSAELEGVKVELLSENGGTTFRVNINDGTPRTRVFSDYNEASDLFDSYVQGN